MNYINCLIIDDHPLVCLSIKNLLKEVPYIKSISYTYSAKDAIVKLKEGNINFLILDIKLGDGDGFDFLRRAIAHGYKGKTLFISGSDSPIHIKAALSLNANGYICKSEKFNLIIEAVDSIYRGYSVFKSGVSSVRNELSNREVVVYNLLIQGKSNNDIAELLSLSPKTVSTYKRRILDKYETNNIIDLISN
ncbi:response regulator transcription factor [Vibrio crassostreae]|uniref:response regulator transcription factor n=1 Tax=Vibrio crassostreae TaxID=246167 RepID=UPI001B30587E|nr:response regulator transcription factor [Vibrio crassostreae]CAK3513097.1 Response regulator transcription factor [Vibrio crassostreae]CAK3516285.1 Response regulator transcription factor [Vibrio crassostreae]CAK3913014.1 Response regulator transcription factor [Vibrio crassostreae]